MKLHIQINLTFLERKKKIYYISRTGKKVGVNASI